MTNSVLHNPYVGPRSFLPGERLYGRDRELRDLFGLLVAERIVLLHSPSGAGKTSLIQAALVPKLLDGDFTVLPVVRVGLAPPAAGTLEPQPLVAAAAIPAGRRAYERDSLGEPRTARASSPNRYTLSTLISLAAEPAPAALLADELPEGAAPIADLAGLSLAAYLDARDRDRGKVDTVLIFDQFEEVLTIDPLNLAAKLEFFTQLGEALRDKRRWALFAMREDYVASLAPYLRPVPTRLSNTFRLDLLDVPGALAAIRQPAERSGADFTVAAASALVDDLRKAKVQVADGTIVEQLGPGVEPVQLQVVCYRLWQRRFGPDSAPHAGESAPQITPDDLSGVADVDGSLAEYYAERVAAAAAAGAGERVIREWVDRKLITPLNIRSQVLRGASASEGLPNDAIAPLIEAYLVRAEQRRGMAWLELAHDRLVGPVRTNNAAWFAANLSPLQRQADLWEQQGRSRSLLFRDADLVAAEAWAAANAAAVSPVEQDFLTDSRELRAAALREQRQTRRIRRLAVVATVVAGIALAALVVAVSFYLDAAQKQRIASARELASAARNHLETDPELSVLLAIQAADTTNPDDPQVSEAADVLQQALNSSHIRATTTLSETAYWVARSPDGASVLIARSDGAVEARDLASGAVRLSLPIQENGAFQAIYSRDGAMIATMDGAGKASLWDASTGAAIGQPFVQASVSSLAFSDDGRALATGSGEGVARIWDIRSGQAREFTHGADVYLYSVAFAERGRTLVSAGGDKRVVIWDIASGRAREELSYNSQLFALAVSPDGGTIAVGAEDGTIYLVSLGERRPLPILRGHLSSVFDLRFNADGTLLASAGADGTAQIWNVRNGSQLLSLAGHNDAVYSVAFSPDGAQISTVSGDSTLRSWSIAPLHLEFVLTLDMSPDGSRLVTGSQDGSIVIWDMAGERPLRRLGIGKNAVRAVAFSPDGQLVAGGGADNQLVVWQVADGREVARMVSETELNDLAFGPDGSWLVSAANQGRVTQWALTNGQPIRMFAGFDDGVQGVAVSADGARIAAANDGGGVQIWEVASGSVLASLPVDDSSEGLNKIAFSPDGARVAGVGEDGRALLWTPGAAGPAIELIGQAKKITGVAFSATGEQLVTTGLDKTVRLWRASDGALESSFTMAAGGYDVRFTQVDANEVLVASADGVVRTIPLQLNRMRDLARRHLTRALTADECAQYHLEMVCAAAP